MKCYRIRQFVIWLCCGDSQDASEQRWSGEDRAEVVYEAAITRGWTPSASERQAVRRAMSRLAWADAATVQRRVFIIGSCSAVAGAIGGGWLVPLGWGAVQEHPSPAQWYAVLALFCCAIGAEIFVLMRRALTVLTAHVVFCAEQSLACSLPGYGPVTASTSSCTPVPVTHSHWIVRMGDALVLSLGFIGGLVALVGELAIVLLSAVTAAAWIQARCNINRAATARHWRQIGPDIERIP